jgi:hypothetical protein
MEAGVDSTVLVPSFPASIEVLLSLSSDAERTCASQTKLCKAVMRSVEEAGTWFITRSSTIGPSGTMWCVVGGERTPAGDMEMAPSEVWPG